MDPNVDLQLEALNQVISWSKWLIAIAGAALAVGIGASRNVKTPNRLPTKIVLVSFSVSFISAIILVATAPYIAQDLPISPERSYEFLSMTFSGIYAVKHFGLIPFWLLQLVQQISFIIGSLSALRILWFELFDHGFFPLLAAQRKSGINITEEKDTNIVKEMSVDWSRLSLSSDKNKYEGKKYLLKINTLRGETIKLLVQSKKIDENITDVVIQKH